MIPDRFITEWKEFAPWPNHGDVEQDLIVTRCLVEMYNSKSIREKFAFRGGTALNKLFFDQPARYSEDIDLVQIIPEPIGKPIQELRKILDPWLGLPKSKFGQGRFTLNYQYLAESDSVRRKLKIEINTAEHKPCFDLAHRSIEISSEWFSGKAEATTYALEELLGTKLRALYQRKKGRDLFDLWYVHKNLAPVYDNVFIAFRYYLKMQDVQISKGRFLANLKEKMSDLLFLNDITPLLRYGINYDPRDAFAQVESIIEQHYSDR